MLQFISIDKMQKILKVIPIIQEVDNANLGMQNENSLSLYS